MEEIRKILDYQPSGVDERDIEKARSELAYFFVNFPLHEAKKNIRELYRGWVHLEAEAPVGEEMMQMLFFCDRMAVFMELAFVVSRQTEK